MYLSSVVALGLMAGIAAAENEESSLLDKGNKLGRKLAISGGGDVTLQTGCPLRKLLNISLEMVVFCTVPSFI